MRPVLLVSFALVARLAAGDAAAFHALVAEPLATYAGTAAADWFREAQRVSTATRTLAAAASAKGLAGDFEALRDSLRTLEFRARAEGMLLRAQMAK